MTVVLIIGILLSVAIATYIPSTLAANASACRHNQRVLTDAVSVIAARGEISPTTVDDLTEAVKDLEAVKRCPQDDTLLVLDVATGVVSCPNHP